MPAGGSVLAKVPVNPLDAEREHAVCEHLWHDCTPTNIVGPVQMVRAFRTIDGHSNIIQHMELNRTCAASMCVLINSEVRYKSFVY
jgi:hypothetical protein